MIKKLVLKFIWLLLCCAFIDFNHSAFAKVYVDIDSPTFRPIPIAIADFHNSAPGTAGQSGRGSAISEAVRQDLALTGLFNILNQKGSLETNAAADKINSSDWTPLGADYLLKGEVIKNDQDIIANGYLFDVGRGEYIFARKYRVTAGQSQALSRAIAVDIMRALVNDEGDFNTKIAFVPKNGLKSDIHSIGYDGTELKSMTSHKSILMTPRWSPDGNWLAFTSFKRGRPEIYIRNLKTGLERKIAAFEGINLCGGFSPDGRKLLLTLSKDGNNEIYMLDINTLMLRRLTNNYAIDVSPSWSPDGKKIAFVSNRSGSPQIYTMDTDGGNVKRITYEGTYNSSPVWSPHGDAIAYEGQSHNGYQIFIIDAEGGNPRQLTSDNANNESPSWSPSGRQIVYVSRRQSKSKLVIMNSNGSSPRPLYETSSKLVTPSWSPRLK
ncbi:MAG: Tol-Pal system beta propeller repeat protein TolB [Smithella sp.]|nr:Tol-Pal system beta propeller repeat protein TolB [Smithella sp.]